jgi:hypothetical protein
MKLGILIAIYKTLKDWSIFIAFVLLILEVLVSEFAVLFFMVFAGLWRRGMKYEG